MPLLELVRNAKDAGATPNPEGRRGLVGRMRRALGIRRKFSIAGNRYRELTTEPLRLALSKRGRGFKDYEVTFRSGDRLRIRCTKDRTFADLLPPATLPVLLRVERSLRPGMRVLVAPCGTGFAAALVAGRVAPSGAVVALDPETDSIEFARLRYPIPNVSFESGDRSDLSGETDGAFDAVLSIDQDTVAPDDALVTELWRLVASEGWMLIAHAAPRISSPNREQGQTQTSRDLTARVARLCAPDAPDDPAASTANIAPMGDGSDGWAAVIARKPARS